MLHITTQIILSHGVVPNIFQIDVENANVSARSNRTALQTSRTRRVRCAFDLVEVDVSDFKLGVGAVPLARGAGELGALGDGYGGVADGVDGEVLERHVFAYYI